MNPKTKTLLAGGGILAAIGIVLTGRSFEDIAQSPPPPSFQNS
jgi:hypothetical protein